MIKIKIIGGSEEPCDISHFEFLENQNQEEKVSLCPHCLCMTKTINGFCGKCKKLKEKKA